MLTLPTEEAASVGMPGTETVLAGRSLETSTRRTLPSARASTKPALLKVMERSRGLRWKRSETLTMRLQGIRDPEGAQVVRGRVDRQAVGLVAPEVIVVDEVVQLLREGSDPALVGVCRLELIDGLLGQVLEQDAVRVGLQGHRRGGQKNGHAHVPPPVGEIGEIVGGGDVEVEHGVSWRVVAGVDRGRHRRGPGPGLVVRAGGSLVATDG